MHEEDVTKISDELDRIGTHINSIANYQFEILENAIASTNSSIDGVKFCEYEEEVNDWISNNPDKKVIDVKFSNTYDIKDERKCYSCLILYKKLSI